MENQTTQTEREIQDAFMSEFQEMMTRYNAEFEMQDVGRDWNSYHVPVIYFRAIYDNEGNVIRQESEFTMPRYIG
jgi:hypothetical protein